VSNEIPELLKKAQVIAEEVFLRALVSFEDSVLEFWEQLSVLRLFSDPIYTIIQANGVLEIVWNLVQDLFLVPQETLAVLLTEELPDIGNLNTRLVPLGRAISISARIIVEVAFDLLKANPPPGWTLYKGVDRKLKAFKFWKTLDPGLGIKRIKTGFYGFVISVASFGVKITGSIFLLLVFVSLYGRMQEPAFQKSLKRLALPQDSKRAYGGKRKQHRVNRVRGPDKSE